jgi:uncharacterized Zn finger protein
MTQTQVGTPARRDAGWFVPSGQVGYFVERVDGRWRCTCPAARWRRQQLCKHVMAVIQQQRKAVPMG